jgi:septum formation protein
MNSNQLLILASNSPRRQQLLEQAGFKFAVRVKDTEESFPESMEIAKVPEYLALKKAEAFKEELLGEEILITADTIVALDNQIFNKPVDINEAYNMLNALSGRSHDVYTGVCLYSKQKQVVFSDRTRVYFRKLEPAEIDYYVENYMPYDKAGAYGAQDWLGLIAIEKIEGSYFNVMGLPVHRVYEELKRF